MRTTAEIDAETKKVIAARADYNAVQNEGGDGYCPQDAKLAELGKERAAAYHAEFAAEWTPETTQARRAAWNEEIRALGTGRIEAVTVIAIAKRLGYSGDDIKRAKQINGIV